MRFATRYLIVDLKGELMSTSTNRPFLKKVENTVVPWFYAPLIILESPNILKALGHFGPIAMAWVIFFLTGPHITNTGDLNWTEVCWVFTIIWFLFGIPMFWRDSA